MKAVRMYAPRDLRVEEVDIPSYEADECLIKVMAVGVCGSDIPRVNQYGAHVSPIIVGHEFGGQIVKTGDKVTKFKAGDRVTCPPLIPCFKCKYCEMGEYSICVFEKCFLQDVRHNLWETAECFFKQVLGKGDEGKTL